jgi:hypothetical protein
MSSHRHADPDPCCIRLCDTPQPYPRLVRDLTLTFFNLSTSSIRYTFGGQAHSHLKFHNAVALLNLN